MTGTSIALDDLLSPGLIAAVALVHNVLYIEALLSTVVWSIAPRSRPFPCLSPAYGSIVVKQPQTAGMRFCMIQKFHSVQTYIDDI